MKLDLIEIAKKALKDKELVIENLPGDKVKVYYINKTGRNTQPIPIIFPRFIDLDEELAEGIGLYVGDGYFNENNFTNANMVTKDEDIAKFMLNFFVERLNIRKSDIGFSISYTLFKEGCFNSSFYLFFFFVSKFSFGSRFH